MTLYAFGNKVTRILSTLFPRFRIAWKLMYRYSMRIACVFALICFFFKPATRYLPLYLLCFRVEAVSQPTRRRHELRFWSCDQVLAEQQKGPNF